MRKAGVLAALVVVFSGCFHATIETGLPASATVIQNDWVHGFVYGLVPPSTMDTKAKCPNGVAKVETQHSFLNGLVAILTGSLYTPITVTVTCASSNRMASLSPGAATIRAADASGTAPMQRAFDLAVTTGQPVFVDLR
jgi:hypothetical protein